MESRIVLPAVALVLALAITSGDALKCYECHSVGSAQDGCSGEMIKSLSREPIECNEQTMNAWHNTLLNDGTLKEIAKVFYVYPGNMNRQNKEPHTPMACVKMNLRVKNQPVTLRTCQTAKTADVDPCKTTRDKISKIHAESGVMAEVEYCGMCETDQCNGSYTLTPIIILSIMPLIASILMSLAYNSA